MRASRRVAVEEKPAEKKVRSHSQALGEGEEDEAGKGERKREMESAEQMTGPSWRLKFVTLQADGRANCNELSYRKWHLVMEDYQGLFPVPALGSCVAGARAWLSRREIGRRCYANWLSQKMSSGR